MTRERAVKEKRAAKQEKKDERKRLAAEAAEGGGILAADGAELAEGDLPEFAGEETASSEIDGEPLTAPERS